MSFKIVTCSENAYEAILKEDVWAPNFAAVPFSKQKPQTKNANENKQKQSQAQLQTPIRSNSRRSEKSGASERNRRVKFDENNRNGNVSQQSVTPRSSRVNRMVFSGNKTPVVNLPPVNNAFAAQMHGNVLQQPAFFGIPGQTHNVMQPLYYHAHQQQMFQQPPLYQQQQAPRHPQQQQYQHQQQRPYQQ